MSIKNMGQYSPRIIPKTGDRPGTLTIMVSGDPAIIDKVKPLIKLMGQNITLVGKNRDGQACKVANQVIVALTIEAVADALLFASKADTDPVKAREALMGGFSSSKILENHSERTFNPGFCVTLHQKDLNLALSKPRKLQIALFNTASAQGGSGLDHSAMVLALKKLAEYEVSA